MQGDICFISPLFSAVMLDSLPGRSLADSLRSGDTLIVPNQRLQRHLQAEFFRHQPDRDTEVVEAPDILTLSGWIDRCYAESILKGLIRTPKKRLRESQAVALWHRTIQADSRVSLVEPHAAARQCNSALRLLANWLPASIADYDPEYPTEEWRAFSRWRIRFDQQLDDLRAHTLEQRIADLVEGSDETLRDEASAAIVLCGFVELTPLEKRLFEIARKARPLLQLDSAVNSSSMPRAHSFDSRSEEIRTAVAWAKHTMDQHPDARVALLVNQLEDYRSELLGTLQESFRTREKNYAFPAAESLSRSPVVSMAGFLLRLALDWRRTAAGTGTADFSQISQLLLSAHVSGGVEESGPRSALERALREYGKAEWSRFGLQRWLSAHIDQAKQPLPHLQNLLGNLDGSELDSVDSMYEMLLACGWPGSNPSEQELQSARVVAGQFEQLRSTAAMLNNPGAQTLLGLLQRQLDDITVDYGGPLAPVQILSLEDIPGREFTHAWLLNVNDQNWPAAAHPNPFIPKELRMQLPRGHASAELAHAQKMSGVLLNSADEIHLSWARNEGDKVFRLSPIFAGVEEQACNVTPEPGLMRQTQSFGTMAIEELPDNQGQSLSPGGTDQSAGSGIRVSGGVSAMQDQCISPFVAYAHLRLGARGLERVSPHLSAKDRGILVHECLRQFWSSYPGRQQAESLGSGLPQTVEQIVSIQVTEQNITERYGANIADITRRHLGGLLVEWIEAELQRPDFDVVDTEQSIDIRIGSLQMRGKIDRIDRLGDGSWLVMDYKTGSGPKVADWLGDHLLDAQLPLYVEQLGKDSEVPVSGIAVASLKPGQLQWSGLCDDGDLMGRPKGLKMWNDDASHHYRVSEWDSWTSLRQIWSGQLNDMAFEIARGDCRNLVFDESRMGWCDVLPMMRRASLMAQEDGQSGDVDE